MGVLSWHPRVLIVVVALCLGTACGAEQEYMRGDARAIALAQSVSGIARIEKYPGNFGWYVVMYCKKTGKPRCPGVSGQEDPRLFPIRVICYCDQAKERPSGWFIEANLETNSARAISGNRVLQRRYDLP
jgi:hypothetical protein